MYISNLFPLQNLVNWYSYIRLNNLSLVCLYLSLYIFFLLFGHFLLFLFYFFSVCQKKKNVHIIKRKYIMTSIDTQETDYSVYSYIILSSHPFIINRPYITVSMSLISQNKNSKKANLWIMWHYNLYHWSLVLFV